MTLLRSLRVRLLLMFMFVVIVTLATVAFIQQQATTNAFKDYTENVKQIYPVRKDVLMSIYNVITTYQSGNVQGLKAQMAAGAAVDPGVEQPHSQAGSRVDAHC
jgi:hypothetical protein